MGVEDYLITSTVNGIVGQRLVRRLCANCRVPYSPPIGLSRRLGLDRLTDNISLTLYKAHGCDNCNGTGYAGRTALVEVMPITPQMQRLILEKTDGYELQRLAIDEGMETMHIHGLKKALAGQTSIEEVLRVTGGG